MKTLSMHHKNHVMNNQMLLLVEKTRKEGDDAAWF